MSAQEDLRLWEEHLKGEFETKDENLQNHATSRRG